MFCWVQCEENWHNKGVLQRVKDGLGGSTVTVLEESLPSVMRADGPRSYPYEYGRLLGT